MLKSFEELAQDVEKFHNNVLVSNALTDSLDQITAQLKESSQSFGEQTAEIGKRLGEVPQQIDEKNTEQSEKIKASLGEEMSKTIQAIKDENEKYAQKLQDVQTAMSQNSEDFAKRLENISETIAANSAENLGATKGCVEEELQKAVSELKAEHEKYADQLKVVQQDVQKAEKALLEKCDEFQKLMDEINASGIYRMTNSIDQKLSSQKILIIVMGILSILAALSRLWF